MYNPDAPTETNGGWLQHTYQPQQNDLYYWGGSMPGSFNGIGMNDGSRRNTFNPVNPMGNPAPNPFSQFGQVQPTSIPEQSVQPFSSYPPSTPQGNNMNMGLNAMVDSRRNVPMPTPQQNNNPWAPQTTTSPFVQQNNPFPTGSNPYDYSSMMGPGFRVDMNTVALYNGNQFSFDKHNTWENCYTQMRPISPPNINWNNPNNNSYYGGFQSYQQPTQFPQMASVNTAQASWKDIAVQNWSK